MRYVLALAILIGYIDWRLDQMWSSHAQVFPAGLTVAQWVVVVLSHRLVSKITLGESVVESICGLVFFVFSAGSVVWSSLFSTVSRGYGYSQSMRMHSMWFGTGMMGLQLVVFLVLAGYRIAAFVRARPLVAF